MSTEKFTPGPWRAFICDDGGQWSGWPLSISSVDDPDKSIVRPGGSYPYRWDAAMSQREAVANAHLIAAAPQMFKAAVGALDYQGLNSFLDNPKIDGGMVWGIRKSDLLALRAAIIAAREAQP